MRQFLSWLKLGNGRTLLAVFASICIAFISKQLIDRFGRGLPPHVSFLRRWYRRRAADAAWRQASRAWLTQPEPPDVCDLRLSIEALKKHLEALIAERDARIRLCAVSLSEAEQRARYLSGFRIEGAKLANIGPARCAVLRSWGIDTAADVDEAKVAEIPGFGKNLINTLVIWRDMKDKGFVYTAARVVDPLEVQRIDRKLAARRTRLMNELRERIAQAEQKVGRFNSGRAALWTQVEAAFNERMLASVNR